MGNCRSRVRVPSNRLGSVGSSVGRAIVNIIETFYQSVAQLGLRRVLWEHEFAGSNPVTLTVRFMKFGKIQKFENMLKNLKLI